MSNSNTKKIVQVKGRTVRYPAHKTPARFDGYIVYFDDGSWFNADTGACDSGSDRSDYSVSVGTTDTTVEFPAASGYNEQSTSSPSGSYDSTPSYSAPQSDPAPTSYSSPAPAYEPPSSPSPSYESPSSSSYGGGDSGYSG